MKNVFKFVGVLCLTALMSFSNLDKKIIVIDVAHGGKDYGAVVDSFKEKEISLEIAKKIKELNKNANVEIILTRESDEFVSLNERADFINELNPHYVLSLHVNSTSNQDKKGMEIFVSDLNSSNEDSEQFAQSLQNSFKGSDIAIKKADFYLLKNVKAPINFLEVGFITNDNDRAYITSEAGQTEIAEAILKVIK
ncbi:MAG: N-acetylmuramoyl-L-alanine amidase [Myroides sp.]